jgi:hypothetical protein
MVAPCTGGRLLRGVKASSLDRCEMVSERPPVTDSNCTYLAHLLKGDDVADVLGADLRDAKLNGANLEGADLTQANLGGASLTGAHLKNVKWFNTTCPDGTNSDNHGSTCLGHLIP